MNADSLSTQVNSIATGVILLQALTGFVGSLIAGALITMVSEKRFNRTIKMLESNIVNTLAPVNETVTVIAAKTDRLPELVPVVSAIGNAIKRLADVVDKMREGLEKTK
ncbi:MAG: hypothetical protein WCE90_08455 [Candidatus Zixiibacteriota bacterium]